jgi:hypothetical protein
MKGRFTLHPSQGYIELHLEGSVTFSELGALIGQAWSDPGWKREYDGLIDFSAATVDLSDGETRDLLNWMVSDPRCSFGRWAFVGGKTGDIRMARLATLFADQETKLRVFLDRPSAKEWLLSARGPLEGPGA